MTMRSPDPTSPFHIGEQAIQSRVGKRDKMEAIGRRTIRSFMPDQHRAFFAHLPFVVMGSVDDTGWPWASILSGGDGFITSPDPRRLDIKARPFDGDPLQKALAAGAPVGILGIELPTRRRNRMNARVRSVHSDGFSLDVDQSFGNCPQYIHTRSVAFVRDPDPASNRPQINTIDTLDEADQSFIAKADTFFVSSYVQTTDNPVIQGVDVSHRGGRPGFVKVGRTTLTVPDYSGNSYFNTLGNFLLNPKAGLIFADFDTGNVLMLTGTITLLWDDHPEIAALHGAERGWRFTLVRGMRVRDALPFRARFGEGSPDCLLSDDRAQADARRKAEGQRDT